MEGESEGGKGWRLAELGGGGALLAIGAAFKYLAAPAYESTAYAIGVAFGSIFGALLLAAAGRWAWVRFGHGSPPVMAPAVVLVAGVIAFLLALGSLGD